MARRQLPLSASIFVVCTARCPPVSGVTGTRLPLSRQLGRNSNGGLRKSDLCFIKCKQQSGRDHVAGQRAAFSALPLETFDRAILTGEGRPLPSVLVTFMPRVLLFQLLSCTDKVFLNKRNMPLFSYVLFYV